MIRTLTRQIWLIGLPAALLNVSAGDVRWVVRTDVQAPTGNLYFTHDWQADKGLHLRFQSAGEKRIAEIKLAATGYELRMPPNPMVPSELTPPPTLNEEELPNEHRDIEFTLTVRPHEWRLFADNRLLLTMPSPFSPPFQVLQPAGQCPAEDDDDAFFQKVADFTFADDFLIPEGEENTLSAWTKVMGNWDLHTAVDSSVERHDIAANASKRPEPSRSPNFYSLTGEGQPAVITAGYDFYDSYSHEAAVLTREGEMGVVFYSSQEGRMYGFTVALADDRPEALFRLWRSDTPDCRRRYVLAAAVAEIHTGQWIKMRTVATGRQVRCYVDHTEVFDREVALPAGGVFGLYAAADGPVRFDDVAVHSIKDLDLSTYGNILKRALAVTGAFTGETKRFSLFGKRKPGLALVMPHRHPGGMLAVGARNDQPHWFSFDVQPLGGNYAVGLLAGYQSPSSPYYRFLYEQADGFETFTLERISGTEAEQVERFRMPSAIEPDARVALSCDATGNGMLKFYRNGILVLAKSMAENPSGSSGVWVESDSLVAFSSFEYRFRPPPVFRNRFEKNRVFIDDPFMRHWSSPEGEWIHLEDGTVWYKGDFHGRFALHMPYVDGSAIHLGVGEDGPDGELVLRSAEGSVSLLTTPLRADKAPLARVPAGDLKPGKVIGDESARTGPMFTVESEGLMIRISSGGEILAKVYRPSPLTGRRVRIEGFSTHDLAHSYVDRWQVQDFLFTESLYNWTINGGHWEVVNRFKCQPRWSHMNGESASGLAALWSKYRFAGDFCVEMYAGMRHGWYERAGDLNLTVMNDKGTPSQGYTITTTGWDPDHSQLWTKLYRNGRELARSSKYLVPRIREDNVRRGYNPLLSSGRPIHGAWYYLKLRRVGDVMQFFFDNELVFSARDSEPIMAGSLGIWTYMNSMMVARVKCAAERIIPLEISVRKVPLDYRLSEPSAPRCPTLTAGDGLHYPFTVPELWSAEDEIGRTSLEWHTDDDGAPYFVACTRLGGGQFLTEIETRHVPLDRLAGWLFFVKRTEKAQFNFHYTLGTAGEGDRYLPSRHCFHTISGSPNPLANYLACGITDVVAAGTSGPDWHRKGEWTPVVVWVDEARRHGAGTGPGWFAKPLGFGNLQPSFVAQGLLGNGPGEAYAVKGMVPILFGPPRLASADGGPDAGVYVLRDSNGIGIGSARTPEELTNMLRKLDPDGLARLTVTLGRDGLESTLPMWWIDPPETPDISFDWDDRVPGAVKVVSASGYPDRRILAGALAANGEPVELALRGVGELWGHLPRIQTINAKSPLSLEFSHGDGITSGELSWDDAANKLRPVLVGVEHSSPIIMTFESLGLGAPLIADTNRMAVGFDPSTDNSYLEVSNRGILARLQTAFDRNLDLASFPLIQFDYRASPMCNVTLDINLRHRIMFSEDRYPARTVRFADEVEKDGQWHSWLCMAPDAINGGGIGRQWFNTTSFQLRSCHKRDQTGLYTKLDLDNVIAGPAVSSPDQLAMLPDFYDHYGLEAVMFAVYAGATPYLNLSERGRDALAWTEVAPGSTIRPTQLPPNGPGHLLVKAQNRLGLESRVLDIPFLVDRKAPKASHSFEESNDPLSNGTMLNVSLPLDDGSPVDLGSIKFMWNDRPVVPDSNFSSFSHSAATDVFHINWPHTFRQFLDGVKNNETNRIVISGLRDGAGNLGKDLVIPLTTDHSKDHLGPTLLSAAYPGNVRWEAGWSSPQNTIIGLEVSEGNSLSLKRALGQTPYVEATRQRGDLQVWRPLTSRQWSLAEHPLFAFRVRRPGYRDGDKTKVELFLSFNRRELYVFPLSGNTKGSLGVDLGKHFQWSKSGWVGAVVDMRKIMLETLMREAARDARNAGTFAEEKESQYKASAVEQLKQGHVRMVGFRVTDSPARDVLHIADMIILDDWDENGSVRFEAYDASGVAGLSVAAGAVEKEIDDMSFRPGRAPTSEWLIVKVRDKAGNHGPEIWVPGRR